MLAAESRRIDWWALRQMPGVESCGLGGLDLPKGDPVYLSTPITAYVQRDEIDIAIQRAAEWQAALLAGGWSPVSPALLTLPPLLARGDDAVGSFLASLTADEWMRHCARWMAMCGAAVVPPITRWDSSDGCWCEARSFASWDRPVRLLRGCP